MAWRVRDDLGAVRGLCICDRWTHKDIERAADEIIAKSMELNTVDNVSVCIICLNQTGEES